MNKNLFPSFKKVSSALLAGLLLTSSLLLAACGGAGSKPEVQDETEPEAPVLLPVAAADGNSSSLLCKDSYTVSPEEVSSLGSKTAAKAGSASLTNDQLQAYYLMEIAAFLQEGQESAPDFSQPLDCQLCPLAKGNISWQHYFLQRAVNTWYTGQVLVLKAQEPQLLADPDYDPNMEWHEKYMAPGLPVHEILYGNSDCYKPNRIHQAYLDQLPELLDSLAAETGRTDLAALCEELLGKDLRKDWIRAVEDINTAYMYFTELRYNVEASEEETADAMTYASASTELVKIRHLLVTPDNASVAADGTVTASEEDWAKCLRSMKDTMFMWSNDWLTYRNSADNFARIANQRSEDEGSRLDGGLYIDIHKGQLEPVLDEWCFASGRKVGDWEILQSDTGVHVLYLCDQYSSGQLEAEQEVLYRKSRDLLDSIRKEYPLTVDYSSAALWADTSKAPAFSSEDTLYPDIAHERFPDAIVYLQQDFPHANYGGGTVARGGCGITTMGMLATYMTDKIYTPAYLASVYGMYRTESGTNGDMFRIVPAELGFYMQRQVFNYDDILEPLENGQRVISLQVLGHFTSAGHYLLLERPNDDNTVVVRDSNIFNYQRLPGHVTDSFTKAEIMSGNQVFWVMENKIVRIPACVRCGDPEGTDMPHKMLLEDYTCEKCATALSRRNGFLNLQKEYRLEGI